MSKDNRTGAQKIQDLENVVASLYQTADQLVRDVSLIKDAVKLLGNKLDAVVQASVRGEPLNDDTLAKIMVENNVAELKGKLDKLVDSGLLKAQDEVKDGSFVVGREIDLDGGIANPRIQFVLDTMQPQIRESLRGKKVGELVEIEEGKFKFEVLESYEIVTPTAPVAVAEAAPAEAPSEAAAE